MLEFGTITGREISQNNDASKKTTLLQVTVSEDEDVQTVELQSIAGEDFQPPDGSRVFFDEVSDTFAVALVVDDGVEPAADLEQGERELYSSDEGARKATIRLKKDGQIVVNGGGGTAIEFARMKEAFDQLKSDFDNLVTAYNAHIHVTTATVGATPTPGVIAPTTSTGAPSTADMTEAESGTVEVP
jgi:phage gp45-like